MNRQSRTSVPAKPILFVVGAFVVVQLAQWGVRLWTDYLWYLDLGQQSVFTTRLVSEIAVGAVFSVAAFVVLYANLKAAHAMSPKVQPVGLPQGTPAQVEFVVERIRDGVSPVLSRVIPWLAGALALANGAGMASQWEAYRLWIARIPFGKTDPQFGADVAFYVFTLPVAESLLEWATGLLLLALILTAVLYLLTGGIRPWEKWRGFAPHVKAHLSVLAALIVASRAFGYWIDIYNLNFSPRGQVTGASYTDVTAQLPAYRILIVISLVTAAVLLLNIRYRGWRLPAIALGVWVAAAIVLGGVWPAVVQRFVVSPNEASREAPYIERNIAMTREAFGIADVKGREFAAAEDLSAQEVVDNEVTLSNVRLWDPEIVKQSFGQLQTIRPYYEFSDVDVDRYMIEGSVRQVLVSAREMNSSLLAEQAQTWVNRHLVYTHGSGVVVAPSNEYDTRGLPRFVVGDIPPRVSSTVASSSPDLEITQPRIYFGESTTDYVVVDTGRPEFDFPQGDENAFYTYEYDGGIPVGGFIRRLALAIRLGSSQVLFSEYITPRSRVLMHREVTDRLERLAPWLVYEDDPYPAIVDGGIVWIVDAYTVSSRYPYSQRVDGGTNYIRNSVKCTVDAFTGEITFYAFDEADPVLASWRNVFPTLVTEGDRMPQQVRGHLRFPQGLFSAQAEVYRTYHMTNPTTFYNKEDQWELPGQRQGTPMEPFFVLLQLPGTSDQHFYLMQPYTPRNRDNMIGWMAASSDPVNYGERTVYQFPKERVIFGPEQVSARIKQDSVISPQISLWSQRGSNVLFGKMQVIPINDAIVFIQPLFLQAEQTAIPELTRVIVAYSDKVAMESTLEAALIKVFGDRPAEQTGTDGEPTQEQAATAQDADRLYREAVEAQKQGDWATYGERIEELGRVLGELAGTDTTSTP